MESFESLPAGDALDEIERLEREAVFGAARVPAFRHGVTASILIFTAACASLIGFYWLWSRVGIFAGLPLAVVFVGSVTVLEKRRDGVARKAFQKPELQIELMKRFWPTWVAMMPMIWVSMWAVESKQPLWAFVAIVVVGMAFTLAVTIVMAKRHERRERALTS